MHPQSDRAEQKVEMRTATEARPLALAEALMQALVLVLPGVPKIWTEASPEVRMRATLAERWAPAKMLGQARARARALVQARAQVPVATLEEAQVEARAEAHLVTYGEVLADPAIMDIISLVKTNRGHGLARDIWPSRHEFWWFIQIIAPITRLPPELLQQIFLININKASHSPLVLMQVCKLWYTIVTGVWASLNVGTTTAKNVITRKLERNQSLLDVLVDTEIDRGHFTPSEGAYQAIFTAIEATSRWRAFVVETFPAQADLPEHVVNRGLQRCSNPIMSRLRTFKIKCPCEMSPLLERLLRMLGTTASGELTTVEIRSPSVISFLAPTYPSIFHFVKLLYLDTPGLPNPVDLLPHLHQLEALTASHISFPIYHNDVDIPFVHTLRYLTLRAVSIQWMSGRTFHVLESCTILFPLRHQVLHTFNTAFPNCHNLTFHGYPLDILQGVSAHNLTQLSVTSSCSDQLRGSRQLVRLSSQVLLESRLAPRILHIGIEAMSWAWIKAFAFMSNLEELVINNAQPSSLGVNVLHSLVVHSVHANNLGTASTHGGGNTPVCPLLKRFGLRYRRWLRSSEHFDLIPEFLSIIWSRKRSKFSLQSFRIWKGSEQKDPLELIEGSWISLEAFEHLANDSANPANDGAIKGGGLLQLVASRLVENLFKPALKCN